MGVIRVKGTGQASAEADVVTLSFLVETKARDYEDTIRKLNTRTEDLRTNLEAARIRRADLKTNSFNVNVENKYLNNTYVFDGYSASHKLHIEIPAIKEILNRVLWNISRGNSGAQIKLSFSVKDKNELRKRALKEAVKVAQGNAAALCEAAGMALGELVKIEHGWNDVRVYDREATIVCRSMDRNKNYADIEPGEVTATDNVILEYITGEVR